MNLRVNLPLLDALDQCWEILARCFEPEETGIRQAILEKYWPKQVHDAATAPGKEGEVRERDAKAEKED